jgi:hypothetical protein
MASSRKRSNGEAFTEYAPRLEKKRIPAYR